MRSWIKSSSPHSVIGGRPQQCGGSGWFKEFWGVLCEKGMQQQELCPCVTTGDAALMAVLADCTSFECPKA